MAKKELLQTKKKLAISKTLMLNTFIKTFLNSIKQNLLDCLNYLEL